MNKIKNFDSKTTYVSPSMKQMLLRTSAGILQASGEPGNRYNNGGGGSYDDDELNNNGIY